MAKTSYLLPFHILIVLILLRISPATTANVTSEKGLSFKVLYSDSVRDPSLYANLTTFQRLERKIQSSESYFELLRRSSYNTTWIRPKIYPHIWIFMVAVNIGSGGGRKALTLELDIGDSITWTQCIPCNPSFYQTQPMFNPIMSPSYRYLPSTSPLCHPPFQRQDNKCFYNHQYLDQTGVSGFLSTETFTVDASSPSRTESIHNLVFGCTHSSHVNFIGEPSGMLGMNRGELSFASQVARSTNGRFSYCFFPPSTASAGFLKFGNDIVMRGQLTPFKDVPNSTQYHLELDGISIDNQRLHFPATTFEVTWIDTSTVATHLIRPAYTLVRQILVHYFDNFHLVPFQRPGLPFDLCYNLPHDMPRFFPNMTWHLRGADLAIRGEELFFVNNHENFFCLGMMSDNQVTILGVLQQYNTRFTYDLNRNQLLFAREDCSHDMENL